MIYEYALDPKFIIELLDKKDTVNRLCDTLCDGRGCAISKYPSNLEGHALDHAREQEQVAKDPKLKAKWQQRINHLPTLMHDLLGPAMRVQRFNTLPWDGSFVDEHNRFPFYTILTQEINNPDRLPFKDLNWLRTRGCLLFNHSDGVATIRNPNRLCEAIRPLLQNSSKISFIEPYFSAEDRFKRVYELYFKAIASASSIRTKDGTRELSIICSAGVRTGHQEMPSEEFEKSCKETYQGILPPGFTLIIHRIKKIDYKQEIHDRFILTDIGGITIGHGTDANLCPKTESCATIKLLNRELWNKWSNVYTPQSQDFNWSDPPVVIQK